MKDVSDTTNDMPSATCPHCGKEFQVDDYYDIQQGEELECPCCEKTIHVIEVDTTITVKLSKMPYGHEQS